MSWHLDRRTLIASAVLFTLASRARSQGMARTLTISRAGARLWVETEGNGEPVLLLHGGLGHMGWFDGLRRHLVERGRQVVLLDSRGMGRSSLGDGLSYAAQEQDALAVLDVLGIPRCDLIGFSDGGVVGYRLAARANSRVRRLVTIGSRWTADSGRALWPDYEGWNRKSLSQGPFKFVVDDYDRLSPDQDFDRLVRAAVAMWKDNGPDGHPQEAIERIAQPALVAVGDSDPFVAVADAAAARSRIKAAQLLVLPGAGHAAYSERADVFLPALDAFFAGV